jgi:hypothetical protein
MIVGVIMVQLEGETSNNLIIKKMHTADTAVARGKAAAVRSGNHAAAELAST